ncbi:hypothetical protein ACQU0X_32125 [Pseudovibrio ascidiaceicola]|uniref:hypothetical protein n=1 Tax=Pseudovibrio ascidiaceicola TaxID=285279 RepID=UPI003D35BA45
MGSISGAEMMLDQDETSHLNEMVKAAGLDEEAGGQDTLWPAELDRRLAENRQRAQERSVFSNVNSAALCRELRERINEHSTAVREGQEFARQLGGNSADESRHLEGVVADQLGKAFEGVDLLRLQGSVEDHSRELREINQTLDLRLFEQARDGAVASAGVAVVIAALVVIGSVLVGGPDLSGIERQLLRLRTTVHSVAKEQGVSVPEIDLIRPSPMPSMRVERVERISPPPSPHEPELIFKREAESAEPLPAPQQVEIEKLPVTRVPVMPGLDPLPEAGPLISPSDSTQAVEVVQ